MTRGRALSNRMFQRVKPPRAGRPAWKCAEAFRRHLRHLPCARCEKLPGDDRNPVVAAHVDHAAQGTRDAKGAATKVADRFCVPLCDQCHREQTDVLGWPTFEKLLPLGDAAALATVYWEKWPGRRDWEAELAEQGR